MRIQSIIDTFVDRMIEELEKMNGDETKEEIAKVRAKVAETIVKEYEAKAEEEEAKRKVTEAKLT